MVVSLTRTTTFHHLRWTSLTFAHRYSPFCFCAWAPGSSRGLAGLGCLAPETWRAGGKETTGACGEHNIEHTQRKRNVRQPKTHRAKHKRHRSQVIRVALPLVNQTRVVCQIRVFANISRWTQNVGNCVQNFQYEFRQNSFLGWPTVVQS